MATKPLLSVEEALKRVINNVTVVSTEEISITEAIGRVTADRIWSRRTQPPVSVSAMDGYAVRSDDIKSVPCNLVRVGSAPAGGKYAKTLNTNEAVRIFTGGPIPNGADTVIIQENVDAPSENDGIEITVRKATPAGTYIRKAGLDFKVGDLGIDKGKLLNARDIGLAASMNVSWLTVRRKPRIALLATGNEIVRPGEDSSPGQIVSSNTYTLAAMIKACGGEPLILGIAPDTTDGIASLVKESRGADLLVTTGGASVGQHDLIQEALSKKQFGSKGLNLNFWKIAMRPGKPLIFGKLDEIPVLGLPGNPVSTMVCGLIFLKPAIETMLDLRSSLSVTRYARLTRKLEKNDERQDYLRSVTYINEKSELMVEPAKKQDSSMMAVLTKANCLIVRAPYDPAKNEGEYVPIIELTGML